MKETKIKKNKSIPPEVKEKFLETGIKKENTENKNPPIYLLIMVFILGALIATAAFIAFYKPKPEPNKDQNGQINDININDTAYRTIDMTMIYSKDCKKCRETNTFEELFNVRNIKYNLKKVEANTEEGKKIIERFGIDRVPTAIIEAEKLKFYPKTKADFDAQVAIGKMAKKFNAYVAPELNLDLQAYFPVYFIKKVPGLCSEKPTITIFDDFYNPENTKSRRILYNFIKDYNQGTDIKFMYAQTQASTDENAVIGNLFLTCASMQGKFIEMEYAMAGIYCNNPFNGDPTILTEPEINGCWTLSNHYGKPLTQTELDIALNRAKIDINTFMQCYNNKNIIYNTAKKTAEELGIERSGTILIDCKETTQLFMLEKSFCAIHPEYENCKKNEEETKTQ